MNFYYHPNPEENPVLSHEESAHVVKVLRRKIGDLLSIVDGIGNSYQVEITNPDARKCSFKIISKTASIPKPFAVHLAIAPTKSSDRLEWFVEKACELGADRISILHTQRTERKKVNVERLDKKAVSAMKQSKNLWKCKIDKTVISMNDFVDSHVQTAHKYVAYVETGQEDLLQRKIEPDQQVVILIGPEGDFSPDEIELVKSSGFQLVSLGPHVLRTETAGVIAMHTVNLINQGL